MNLTPQETETALNNKSILMIDISSSTSLNITKGQDTFFIFSTFWGILEDVCQVFTFKEVRDIMWSVSHIALWQIITKE